MHTHSICFQPKPVWTSHHTQHTRVQLNGGLRGIACCRVPIEGRNIHELKLKVATGHFTSIQPGTYSAELINICHSLLTVDPQKRPTPQSILTSPAASKWLYVLPAITPNVRWSDSGAPKQRGESVVSPLCCHSHHGYLLISSDDLPACSTLMLREPDEHDCGSQGLETAGAAPASVRSTARGALKRLGWEVQGKLAASQPKARRQPGAQRAAERTKTRGWRCTGQSGFPGFVRTTAAHELWWGPCVHWVWCCRPSSRDGPSVEGCSCPPGQEGVRYVAGSQACAKTHLVFMRLAATYG